MKHTDTEGKTAKTRYKICPTCRNFTIYSSKEKFCIVCGDELLTECKNCKEPILYPTSKFCPACGAMLQNLKINKERKQ